MAVMRIWPGISGCEGARREAAEIHPRLTLGSFDYGIMKSAG